MFRELINIFIHENRIKMNLFLLFVWLKPFKPFIDFFYEFNDLFTELIRKIEILFRKEMFEYFDFWVLCSQYFFSN